MVIRGEQIHSPKALYPMEAASPLETLDLLKYFLQNYPHILDNDHSVWSSFSIEDPCSFVLRQDFFQLAPHCWRYSYYTGLDVIPRNRYTVVNFCLLPIPTLEIILAQHTAPRINLALISLQIHCRALPIYLIRKFLVSLRVGWALQVFNLRITPTSIWFIRHDGDRFLLNQRKKYMLEWKCLLGRIEK